MSSHSTLQGTITLRDRQQDLLADIAPNLLNLLSFMRLHGLPTWLHQLKSNIYLQPFVFCVTFWFPSWAYCTSFSERILTSKLHWWFHVIQLHGWEPLQSPRPWRALLTSCPLTQGFSTSALLTFGARGGRVILCIVGCLTASLTSTH